MNQSQKIYTAVRRDIFACMETGNFDRARTVFEEYRDLVQNSESLEDLTKDLKAEVVSAYAVSL